MIDEKASNPLTLPELPVVHTPQFDETIRGPQVMWLGHASCYVQLPTSDGGIYGILFDPIFSAR
jgi:hypothetical protein